ncbi:hypothetical protein ACROYT_G016750 [Oculina patagonica]
MGGVDTLDQLLGTYQYPHKSQKWYHTVYHRVREVALVNGFILYRKASDLNKLDPKQFREAVIDGLLKNWQPSRKKVGRPSLLPELRLTEHHFPDKYENPKKLGPERAKLDLDDPPIERALGILWLVGDDTLGFKIKDLDRPKTKRGILSTVCSLFDPLGFAAPVALAARCLVQNLWKANLGWDEHLSEESLLKWRSWKSQLPSLSQLRIPRSYFLPDDDPRECKLQLHVFSDASEVGYGTSSYLRVENTDGRVHCTFVMGKARNAPVKFVSIPRLELQAAVLATPMCKMLREELELNIDRTFLWTDSEIVLHYLKNDKRRLQTFVANRVEEIKEHSLVQDWNHVPGTLNPAGE